MIEQYLNSTTQPIVSEVELIYKSKIPPSERPAIRGSEDAFWIFDSTWNKDKIELVEQFKVMYLNNANRVLAISEISSGGLTSTIADSRLIFAIALKLNATSLLLCHNHPSGKLEPSEFDNRLTQRLTAAGKLLDIKVNDHIILSSEGYFSYADQGCLS